MAEFSRNALSQNPTISLKLTLSLRRGEFRARRIVPNQNGVKLVSPRLQVGTELFR